MAHTSQTTRTLRLSHTVFNTLTAFSVVVLLVVAIAMTFIFYASSEQQAESDLLTLAQNDAGALNPLSTEEQQELLRHQMADGVRFTLIDAQGGVLYDSKTSGVSTMENHADRPEIEAARNSGDAISVRHSKTLGIDTLYAAVELDNGSIIRLAQDRQSLATFLGNALLPLIVMLAIVIFGVFVLSRTLSTRIMKPIDELDVRHPLDNEVYFEMEPLLKRINNQQEQLKRKNEELAQAEMLRRDFSSNVSHDMKTPVHVISGYAELMKSGTVAPEDVKVFSQSIFDEAQALRALIDDVLTLSQLDEVGYELNDLRIIDMTQIADRVLHRVDLLAEERNVTLQNTSSSDPVYVCGNETLLEEMVSNLVENAIRYNKPKGSVSVCVSSEGHEAVISVSDTGSGIPENMCEKIFERFYRLEKSRSKETGGTGLGLAIVKHVAQRHQGSVEVNSRIDEGSTFIVHLPLVENLT